MEVLANFGMLAEELQCLHETWWEVHYVKQRKALGEVGLDNLDTYLSCFLLPKVALGRLSRSSQNTVEISLTPLRIVNHIDITHQKQPIGGTVADSRSIV